MDLYTEHKERIGFGKNHIANPDTLAHFNIDAFSDKIECNMHSG